MGDSSPDISLGISPILNPPIRNAIFDRKRIMSMPGQPATTLPGLLKEFASEAKTFVREEVQLAKTEIGENLSALGGPAAMVGIGASGAFAGLIVFLVALGMLGAYAFQQLQLDSSLAMSAGFGAVGVLAIIIGAVMLLVAAKAFTKETLMPERALAKLSEAPGVPVKIKFKTPAKEQKIKNAVTVRSSDLEKQVMATEDRLGRTFEELERRLTFGGMRRRMIEQVQMHPYRAGVWALFAGFAASIYIGRKLRF
jgi:hypothetical protein